MTQSLTLGSLLLTDSFPDNDYGFVVNVLADGSGFGTAPGVQEIVTSLLADGDLVRTRRYGNREATFQVQITGPSLGALAYGEVALRNEVGRPNTLTWEAPDVLSAPTVFEVLTSEMSQTFDDLDELRRRRTFTVTLTCAPHARSAEPVTVEAMVSGTSSVTIDTCDVATGWTGTRSGAPESATTFWEAGAVAAAEFSSVVGFPPEDWTLTRTGTIDLTATPYLEVELTTLSAKAGAPLSITCHAGATTSAPVLPILMARQVTDGSGYYRVVFDGTAVGSVSALTFAHTSVAGYGHKWQGILVRNIARTDISPNVTARQQTRIINPGGTERTPASIHVTAGDGVSHNGLTIVHTCPEDGSGYSPPLRRWRTSASAGTETTDTATLSGKREPIAFAAGGFFAEVPTSSLPEGGYVLMARLRMPSAPEPVDVAWSTSTIFPDTTTQQGFLNGTKHVAFNSPDWRLVPLAALSLPSVRTKAGKVQIVLQVPTTDHAQVELDEAWLFRADDDCALTIVQHYWPHLWLDSPDVTSPVPRVWMGDDRTVQVHPGEALTAMGNHILNPAGTAVFTASNCDNPATEATFYRRWSNNAAE